MYPAKGGTRDKKKERRNLWGHSFGSLKAKGIEDTSSDKTFSGAVDLEDLEHKERSGLKRNILGSLDLGKSMKIFNPEGFSSFSLLCFIFRRGILSAEWGIDPRELRGFVVRILEDFCKFR